MTDNRCSPDSDQALVVLVDRFAKRLLAKLRLAHANGRSGWEKDDWEQQCQDGLLRHLEKGDPRDVAAYCAFMDHHGWITRSPDVAAAPVMQAAQNAVKVVDGWSDSKREYADRVTGAAQASGVEEESEIELLAGRLAGAELNYRNVYEQFGAEHIEAGRMWDKMRKAGDAIRQYKYDAGIAECEATSSVSSTNRGTP